jgi:hypothetical protein
MPTRKKYIKAYLTPDEANQITTSAAKAGLSVSMFVKRVCLGQTIGSTIEHEAIKGLLKANADLGRLGGLFKKALVDGNKNAPEIRAALRKIEAAKEQMTRAVEPVILTLSKKGKK